MSRHVATQSVSASVAVDLPFVLATQNFLSGAGTRKLAQGAHI
jgi:hypothetical protein